jgi:hypothetical protein
VQKLMRRERVQMNQQVLQHAASEHQHFIDSQQAALQSVLHRLTELRVVTEQEASSWQIAS